MAKKLSKKIAAMKKAATAHAVKLLKYAGSPPFFGLKDWRVVARIVLDENHVLQKHRGQPSYRAVLVAKRKIRLNPEDVMTFHIWPASDRKGYDGEARVPR